LKSLLGKPARNSSERSLGHACCGLSLAITRDAAKQKNLATSPGLTSTVLTQRCFSGQQVSMIRKKTGGALIWFGPKGSNRFWKFDGANFNAGAK
jgi:hypothetical protein